MEMGNKKTICKWFIIIYLKADCDLFARAGRMSLCVCVCVWRTNGKLRHALQMIKGQAGMELSTSITGRARGGREPFY